MKVGMISVTLNAANPMTEAILHSGQDISLVNYIDTGLMDLVNQEGKIADKSISRLLSLIEKAVNACADAVLLTCTVFSPYVDHLNSLFSLPIVSADGAMIEEAVRMGERIVIICTFPATKESSSTLFHAKEAKLGIKRMMDIILLEEAFRALQRGDRDAHDRLILDNINKLASSYDVIVLAQMSMAHVADLAKDCTTPILTSPKSAIDALLKVRNMKHERVFLGRNTK